MGVRGCSVMETVGRESAVRPPSPGLRLPLSRGGPACALPGADQSVPALPSTATSTRCLPRPLWPPSTPAGRPLLSLAPGFTPSSGLTDVTAALRRPSLVPGGVVSLSSRQTLQGWFRGQASTLSTGIGRFWHKAGHWASWSVKWGQ